jgi:hypothetical protein
MKGKREPAATLLRPLLETFPDAAIALIGCTAAGIDRYSCEMDVLLLTGDRKPPTSLRIGDVLADIRFLSEREFLRPTNPEHSMALANLKPVRDTSLILSTSSATNLAIFSKSANNSSRGRLTSSLKVLGRAEEAFAKERVVEADFWLLAATYEFAYAWLFSKELVPSPSHILTQLREATEGEPRKFEAFSTGAGLDAAGRAGCGARLEGAIVLHDIIREESKTATADSEWTEVRSQILDGKARELLTRIELAECYSYLGQDLVDSLLTLVKLHPRSSIHSLASGENRLLSERLTRQLGIARTTKDIRNGLSLVKAQVSLLAKET